MAKNLLVGITVPFSSNVNSLNGGSASTHFRSLGIGPSIRYYVGNSRVKPFAGVSFTYNNTSTRYDKLFNTDNIRLKGNSTTLTPTVGVAYFINHNVLLSAGLGYNFYHTKNEGIQQLSNPTTFTIITLTNEYRNASLEIGFALLFGK